MGHRWLEHLAASTAFKVSTSILTYSLYSVVFGLSFSIPIAYLGVTIPAVWRGFGVWSLLCTSVMAASAIFIWFIWSSLVFALSARAFTLGIKPGRYPVHSLITLRWVIASGIYMLATRTFLPFLQMSPYITMFFRIMGCRIGRNVWMNTFHLNDAYLMDIEDDVVLGGECVISAHIFENDHLILAPVRIGRGALIGTHAYIGPGCEIGDHAVIGMYAHVNKNTFIPPHRVIQEIGGLPVRDVVTMRRLGRGRNRKQA